jgi:hypothetical protein
MGIEVAASNGGAKGNGRRGPWSRRACRRPRSAVPNHLAHRAEKLGINCRSSLLASLAEADRARREDICEAVVMQLAYPYEMDLQHY